MVRWNCLIVTVAVWAFAGFGSFAAAGEVKPSATEKSALRALEANASVIVGIAYPTITYSSVEYDGGTRYTDGTFSLVYTFYGTWDGQRGYFTQTFYFSESGKLTNIKDGPRSWLFVPFAEWELTREFVIKFFEKELAKDPKLHQLLKNGTGRTVAIGMLNAKLGF